jgi:hypothetical protein
MGLRHHGSLGIVFAGLALMAGAGCSSSSHGSAGGSSLLPAAAQTQAQTQTSSAQAALLPEFRPFAGARNNLANPGLDAVPGSAELRIAPPNFAPGSGDALVSGPNPRTISNVIAGGTGANGQNGETNDPTLSAWMYAFGQFIDHDLSLEETPPNSPAINIVVPAGDPVFPTGAVIAMTRCTRSPYTNTIINTVSAYLNLSQVYGSTPDVAASLENADGTLKTSGNGLYLPVVSGVFVAGDVRVMENPELTAITTLFVREHNYWVKTLKAQHPNWSPDQLYQSARAVTIAEYQNIIYSGYLPHLIGSVLGPYRGYDPNANPQVTQEFSTAAFRVGHSMVSDTQEGISSTGAVVFTEPLPQSFFNTAATDESNGIDPLLNSLASDYSQAVDVYTVGALRNFLHAALVGGDVDTIDLIAIDIQRERDIGLGTLNQTRQALGLQPYPSFARLTSDPVLQAGMASLYGNINNVDLFMGGLAEAHAPGAAVGPTFQAIIADQFQRLRSGDRFFWQNQPFDAKTAASIASTTIATIMARNTVMTNTKGDLFVQGRHS